MIELNNVSVEQTRKGIKHQVLDNLCCSVPENAHVGLIGRHEAGKQTCLRVISRQKKQFQGTVEVDGKCSLLIGGSVPLTRSITARDNAIFLARVLGFPVKTYLEEVTEIFQNDTWLEKTIASFPPALKTRLYYALTMAGSYEWYVADVREFKSYKSEGPRLLEYFLQKTTDSAFILAANLVEDLAGRVKSVIVLDAGKAIYFPDADSGFEYFLSLKAG